MERISIFARDEEPPGDLAWDYFFSSPVSKEMHRDAKTWVRSITRRPTCSRAWTIITSAWGSIGPGDRYIVISLSFDAQGEEKPLPWIEGRRWVYDLTSGAFSAPPGFAEHNAKAVKAPSPKSE